MKTLIAGFVIALFCGLQAQNTPAAIDEYRMELNKKIAQEEVQYYAAVLNTVLPGTGKSRRMVDFHFNEFREYGSKPEAILLKAEIDYNIAASAVITIAYVFSEKGKLLYYTYKEIGYTCYVKEYYYDDERLIKVRQQPIEENCLGAGTDIPEAYELTSGFSSEDKENALTVLQRAGKYKEGFYYLFDINNFE